jgi:hypothetical protein
MNDNTERAAFEAWYVADAQAQGFPNMTADYMAGIREGEGYGDERHMLNGKWEGWQAGRNTKDAEIAALRKALDAFEQKARGIPQAHIAGRLVAELREAIAQAVQAS